MTGKCRVAPIKGITVPKAEFNGLLDLSRLLKTVIRSMSTLPERVYILGDLECWISILEKSGSALSPYFSNRAAEIRSNISEIVGRCIVEDRGLVKQSMVYEQEQHGFEPTRHG